MSNDKFWVSRALNDSTIIKGFVDDSPRPVVSKPFTPEQKVERKRWSDARKNNEAGIPLPADVFPKKLCGKYPNKIYKRLPDICRAGPWIIVSKAVADVFKQFDLGAGNLYPVEVLQHDRETPVSGTYFHLHFGNAMDIFLPEHSSVNKRKVWSTKWIHRHLSDLTVRSVACSGPDIILDPKVLGIFFLSDALAQTLRDAKLSRHFGLQQCKVMQDN